MYIWHIPLHMCWAIRPNYTHKVSRIFANPDNTMLSTLSFDVFFTYVLKFYLKGMHICVGVCFVTWATLFHNSYYDYISCLLLSWQRPMIVCLKFCSRRWYSLFHMIGASLSYICAFVEDSAKTRKTICKSNWGHSNIRPSGYTSLRKVKTKQGRHPKRKAVTVPHLKIG